jgi:hypothetical protein
VGVVNNLFHVAGNNEMTPLNIFFVQPFINYNLKKSWALMTAPGITANWESETDQRWTLPFGMGIAKIAMVGKQALSLSLQFYLNSVHPDNAFADSIRLQVAFLFSK